MKAWKPLAAGATGILGLTMASVHLANEALCEHAKADRIVVATMCSDALAPHPEMPQPKLPLLNNRPALTSASSAWISADAASSLWRRSSADCHIGGGGRLVRPESARLGISYGALSPIVMS